MKKYYVVSLVLFMLSFIGVNIAKVIFGGETIVPLGWLILFGCIILNTLIAGICIVVHVIRG